MKYIFQYFPFNMTKSIVKKVNIPIHEVVNDFMIENNKVLQVSNVK